MMVKTCSIAALIFFIAFAIVNIVLIFVHTAMGNIFGIVVSLLVLSSCVYYGIQEIFYLKGKRESNDNKNG